MVKELAPAADLTLGFNELDGDIEDPLHDSCDRRRFLIGSIVTLRRWSARSSG